MVACTFAYGILMTSCEDLSVTILMNSLILYEDRVFYGFSEAVEKWELFFVFFKVSFLELSENALTYVLMRDSPFSLTTDITSLLRQICIYFGPQPTIPYFTNNFNTTISSCPTHYMQSIGLLLFLWTNWPRPFFENDLLRMICFPCKNFVISSLSFRNFLWIVEFSSFISAMNFSRELMLYLRVSGLMLIPFFSNPFILL